MKVSRALDLGFFLLAITLALIVTDGCGQAVTAKDSSSTAKCSATLPARIIQNYLLQYNADEDKTYFEASLRAGHALGSSLSVQTPCALTTSSATLKERTIGYTRYVARTTGVTTSAVFTFTDFFENPWTNTVALSTITLVSPPASISAAANCKKAGESGCFVFNFTPTIDPLVESVILEMVDSKLSPMAYKTIAPYRVAGETTASKFSITNFAGTTDSIEYTFPIGQPLFARAVREVRTKIPASGDTGGSGFLVSRYYSAYASVTVAP